MDSASIPALGIENSFCKAAMARLLKTRSRLDRNVDRAVASQLPTIPDLSSATQLDADMRRHTSVSARNDLLAHRKDHRLPL